MIYFVLDPHAAMVKIGCTRHRLKERFRGLRKEFGPDLIGLAVLPGHYREERAIHERFAHLRRAGEWFRPGPDLLHFIGHECRPWDDHEFFIGRPHYSRDEPDFSPRPTGPGVLDHPSGSFPAATIRRLGKHLQPADGGNVSRF